MMMASGYARVLKTTGVTGYPFVHAAVGGTIGSDETQVRRRVDDAKLFDMSAYISGLPAPRGAGVDPAMFARGREIFRTNCTACHNVDQSKPVPPLIVGLKQLWPGYRPIVLMPRVKTLSPVRTILSRTERQDAALAASVFAGLPEALASGRGGENCRSSCKQPFGRCWLPRGLSLGPPSPSSSMNG